MTDVAHRAGIPIYLVIDEYDNFTNALIRSPGKEPYKSITHGSGFYRQWFKQFKGVVDRIFMTGVSPVTMDDLTSGFNIAANISQDRAFNAMLGFTTEETLALYRDFKGEIRLQGYMQAEFGHIRYYLAKPEMELSRGYCDFCLFPERVYNGDVRDSYIIELKYSKSDASDVDLAAKAEEGIAQLRRYAADPTVPALAKDTRLHLILYLFKGTELIRLEEIQAGVIFS